MTGVKGRSGGARKGAGGVRAGAGRPPKEPAILTLAVAYADPAMFLRAVMNDSGSDAKLRVDAAKALMPFTHKKLGEGGKKGEQDEAAKKAASKVRPSVAPLRAVK